jgi:hypothetical protein
MPEEKNTTESKPLTWQAPEFLDHRKHPLWFVGLGIITALLVLFGIYTKSWTTAIMFGLFGFGSLIYSSQRAKTVTITLSGTGVQIDNKNFDYRNIRKFWIVYHPPVVKCLYLETNAYINHLIKIELIDQDPRAIREFLAKYLEEDLDGEESIVDVVARKVKF